LESMRSVTRYGIAVITLVFRDDIDIYFARQQVHERLAAVSDTLPEGAETEMGPIATAMGEIYQYTIEGDAPADPADRIRHLTELRTIQDWVVVPLLKSVPGVNEVNSFGGYHREFQVIVDPDRMLKYRLAITDVFEALHKNNANVGGGFVEGLSEQYIVRGIALIASSAEIARIIVKVRDGVPIYVGDIGEVRDGHSPRQGLALKDGKGETVGGIVMMLRGENSREVVRRVKDRVEEINRGNALPDGLRLQPFYDRSEIVMHSIATSWRALGEGVVLVVVVFYLLLRNLRGAAVVVMALPLSIFLTFIVMKQAGLSANLMSLGGLVISIGMIIDAAIIQVENVQRHLGKLTDPSRKAATVLRAVLEVRRPSIFGELIIALTFVPIVTLQGIEGKMFSPLALTVAIALISSLLLSIFVIPGICALFLRAAGERESPVMRAARRIYTPVLELNLSAPPLVVAGAAMLIAAGVLLVPSLGTEFMPVMDEGAFDMDFQLVPSVSLEKAGEIADLVQKRLMSFPELVTVVSRTGQTGVALEARGVDKTGFVGMLRPKDTWQSATSSEEMMERMRHSLEDIPGLAFSFSQPIQCRIDELMAGTKAQIIVKLFGEDMQVLQEKTREIAGVLGEVPGCADLVVEKVSGQPYLTIRVDRNRIARYGINAREVLEVVEIAIGGMAASQIYEGSRVFELVVRYPRHRRESLQSLHDVRVATGDGIGIPLSQVADISLEEGPVQISRENGMRRMAVELNVTGRDIGSFVADAQRLLEERVNLPSGYTLVWGGQFAHQQQAMRRLLVITSMVVVLITFLLFMTFRSAGLSLLVLLNLPFALLGGVFALMLSGLYLSVPASVGFITLLGVAVLNGLVLVAFL
ncbi:MAG: CusA/CzcA family heavy metal efflux RND transporter, partial [Acidobacteriota bacterium]